MTERSLNVFTFKEAGRLLSMMAHDLRFRVTEFTLDLGVDGSVSFEVDLRSIRVEGAMRNGVFDGRALRDADLAKIDRNTADDVLQVGRFPSARFVGAREVDGDGFVVRGELELHGRTRPMTVRARRHANELVARVELVPSQFGIAPFSALAGTLRLQDRVLVELRLPATEV